MKVLRFIIMLLALCLASFAALGESAGQSNGDEALEARARSVSRSLRCVVCQNQSIEDSDAPLAADMRAIVRQQIKAGKSDADIRAFMQERYGDFVLLKPPLKPSTYALWTIPFLLIAVMIGLRMRATKTPIYAPQLSQSEREAFEGLTARSEDRPL